MNDKDQSIAAASGPHRHEGDTPASSDQKTSFWDKLRSKLTSRAPNLREDLQEALETSVQDGLENDFSDGERLLIQNVLKMSHTRVEDVMVNRADIEAAEIDDSVSVLIARFRDAGHSRLPLYDDTLDSIIGMVHIKDLLLSLAQPLENAEKSEQPEELKTASLSTTIAGSGIARDVLYVPPSMPVSDLLQNMQATRIHMAIVVDEYGGTDGLVTIEDLIEEVVGDIEDEHDEDAGIKVSQIDDNTYMVDARCELEDVMEAIGSDFNPGEEAEDVDTLGGLVTSLVDRVPVRGEVITKMKGFEFEIVNADPRRVRTIKVTRRRRGARQKQRVAPKNDLNSDAGTKTAAE